MRTCTDVHNCLAEEGVRHEIVQLPSVSRTAQDASKLLGVPAAEVVRSFVFLLDDEPWLVLVPGDSTVDKRSLAVATGADLVVPAKAQQVLRATGYRVGAVPPCGLAAGLPVVADPRVFEPRVVYCGGGTTSTMLKIRGADLEALLRPIIAPVGTQAAVRSSTL